MSSVGLQGPPTALIFAFAAHYVCPGRELSTGVQAPYGWATEAETLRTEIGEPNMRKFLLAAVAALTFGVGSASAYAAQVNWLQDHSHPAYSDDQGGAA